MVENIEDVHLNDRFDGLTLELYNVHMNMYMIYMFLCVWNYNNGIQSYQDILKCSRRLC